MNKKYYLPIYGCFIILLIANGTVIAKGLDSAFGTRYLAFSTYLGNNSFFTNEQSNSPQVGTATQERVEQPDRWFAWDKFWHFSASFVTVGAGYHLCANRMRLKPPLATGISIGGTLGIGTGKELIDRYGFHRRFSWKDLVADVLGIGVGYFVFIY